MTEGLHHHHRRKRIYQRHEPYPHDDKAKRFMDRAIYGVGIFGPVMTLPQVIKIWGEQNAAGVSLISWVAYLIAGGFWLSYGIMHKEKPIIMTYSIWIALEIVIIAGVILYG